MQDYHAEFVEIYNKNITRPGADRLLNWLETTDFFTAPASTRFHGACECGLVMHSINVYNAMMQHFFTEGESAESYAICGLLHDLCKANFYKVGTRNVKNDVTGQWEKVPFYQVADQLPYGHGEKSVYLIEHFMRLKPPRPSPSAGTWAALTMRPGAAALPSRKPTTSIPLPSSCTSLIWKPPI